MRLLLVADVNSIHVRRWVAALAARGHDVHVATLRDGAAANATTHVLATHGLGKLGYLLSIPSLRRLVRRIRPDIVHAHYVTSYGYLAAFSGASRLIVTAWGSDVLLSRRQRPFAWWADRFALQRADVVTTVAEHMNAAVSSISHCAHIVTIPFGVDLDVFGYVPAAASNTQLQVVCTRNFQPLYDVATVIRAVAVLPEDISATLTLVGDGPERPALVRLAEELRIAGRVRFAGHVSPEDLARALSGAHLFVTPSHSDGNNVSLNEAMAVGCFPIATDIPANRQWIDHGRNGLLFRAGDSVALADALVSAWSDPRRRREASVTNRAIVERRANWQASVDETVRIYERLAGGELSRAER